MVEVLVPLGLFASIVLILYLFFTTRNKERIALIEKGADASLFKTKMGYFPALKLGMFFVGVGIGILIGNIIAISTPLNEVVAHFSMILLFGGLSLILYYLIAKKKTENEKLDN